VLYKVRAGLGMEGRIGVTGKGWGHGMRPGAVARWAKARTQGGQCTWRVCVGSGVTWTRGWERSVKVYLVDKLHQGQESPCAESGWRLEEHWGWGMPLALFLLCPSPAVARAGDRWAAGSLA